MNKGVNLQVNAKIWREAKAEAALSGQSLRDFVEQALQAEIKNSQRIRLSL